MKKKPVPSKTRHAPKAVLARPKATSKRDAAVDALRVQIREMQDALRGIGWREPMTA